MSGQLSKNGNFRLKGGKILFIRFGPASAQKQTHNRRPRNMRTLEPRRWDVDEDGDYTRYKRRTPVNRGIWVFPYPFHDPFFYFHVFDRKLPKRFRNPDVVEEMTDEEATAFHEERYRLLDEIRKSSRPSYIWWDRPFYSHIRPPGMPEQNWYLWTSTTDWIAAARKELYTWDRWGDHLFRSRYSSDHLECFLPMSAKK